MLRILSVLAVLSAIMLSACSGPTGQASAPDDRADREQKKAGSIFGKSITFGPGAEDKTNNGSGVAVNGFLWRAALDTISFLPVAQADPFGGVIITDWYSPPETPDERFKLNVYILGRQLRSDGVRVSAFKQQKQGAGEWQNVALTDDMAAKLEDAILMRARQLRIASQNAPE